MNAQTQPVFSCTDVRVCAGEKEIVKGVDLSVAPGEIHVIMGPNGSGKSTFAAGVMGHPQLTVSGTIAVSGEDVSGAPVYVRAQKGLFLGFQYPVAVPGVTVAAFLRAALGALGQDTSSVFAFRKRLEAACEAVGVSTAFLDRYLNDGFSGGEKKRLEILQMTLIRPAFAILDEIDSGLDVDALKAVATGIQNAASEGTGVLLVTHYQRLVELVHPHVVHYFWDGRIALTGDASTVSALEAKGYDWLKAQVAAGNEVRA